jgi:hypothetical protein
MSAALVLALAAIHAPAALAGFTQIPQFGASATLSMAWGDSDLDGDLDLAVGNYFNQGNELYVNQGGGVFTRLTPFGAANTLPVVWGDYDSDGDPDLAVGNGANGQNRLYVNNGNNTFTGQNQFGTSSTPCLAWADYDLDGDLDLAVGNGILGVPQQNYLYVNNGDGTFTQEAQFGGEQTDSIAWADYDGDGDPDLAVGNGGFGYEGPNALYINNGDGTFTLVAQFGGNDTACVSWGDYDNDADLDLAVANWNNGQSRLYLNQGDGTFGVQVLFEMRDPNTLAWGDYDLDGDLDLAVGNGDFQSAAQNYLHINNGDGTFTEVLEFGLGSTDAVVWGDYDGDGDLDVAVGNEHSPRQNYLYLNDENTTDWIIIKLTGHHYDLGVSYSNRDAVGAKVFVFEAGFLGDFDHLLGFREIEAHGGFSSQGPLEAHFGVPGHKTVDVRIVWPGSGGIHRVQDLASVASGQRHFIHEAGVVGLGDLVGVAPSRPRLRVVPNPVGPMSPCSIVIDEGTALIYESLAARLGIYDAAGRLVRSLRFQPAFESVRVEWDRMAEDGTQVAPGVYFARLRMGRGGPSERIVVLR